MNAGWIRNFAAGIHSDIPICCVLYFCNVWTTNYSDEDRVDFSRIRTDSAMYVRCPDCIKKDRVVKIHRCVPDIRACFLNEFDKNFYPPRPKQVRKKVP